MRVGAERLRLDDDEVVVVVAAVERSAELDAVLVRLALRLSRPVTRPRELLERFFEPMTPAPPALLLLLGLL